MNNKLPLGRWMNTVNKGNMPFGDLVWNPVAKGGLKGQSVFMAGREFAVLRPKAAGKHRQWNVRINGFIWSSHAAALPGSVVSKMNIKETPVGAFKTVAEARKAVIEAHRLLAEYLQLEAA